MITAHAHADAATEVLRSFNPLPRLRPKPVTQRKRIDVHQFQNGAVNLTGSLYTSSTRRTTSERVLKLSPLRLHGVTTLQRAEQLRTHKQNSKHF